MPLLHSEISSRGRLSKVRSKVYKDSNQKVRQAFFPGLLTGYAVALKLL